MNTVKTKMEDLKMNAEQRQRIEKMIAMKCVRALLKNGFKIGINDGEETTIKNSNDQKEIREALQTTDEDYIYAYKDEKVFGWIYLVYGNDGWDVICDYTVNLSTVIDPICEWASNHL